MPERRKGESKDDFMGRCIPHVMKKEGKSQDEAVAICNSLSEQKKNELESVELQVEETENSIRVRVRDPDDFQQDSFRTITIDKDQGIKAVIGRPKGKETTEVQVFIFDKAKGWTKSKAKKWVKDHKDSAMEDEKKKKKDYRLRIEEDDEGYMFFIDDSTGISQRQSKVGNGITLFFMDEGRFVTGFHFAKPDFSFDDVKDWLADQGFDPSDQQKVEFEKEGRLVYLEDIPSQELSHNEIFEDDTGNEWLRCEAIAIAPGTWKEFNFSLDVLHTAAPLYDGINIVEHHSFEEPGDVKGRSLGPGHTIDEGVITSFVVFDKDSIRKIKSGFFHSVSSNFLLTVDDENNVMDISKVLELTLTDNPACEKAIITGSEPMGIGITPVVAMEDIGTTTNSDTVIAVFTKETEIKSENENPPPIVEDNGGTMSKEQENQLEETSAKLEVAQAELEAKDEAIKKMNARLEILERQKLELEADEATRKWLFEEKKVALCVEKQFRSFYLSLDDDTKKSFESMLKELPTVLPTEDVGVPLIERTTELEEEEKELTVDGEIALTRQLLANKRKGQGIFAKDKVGFHIGNYDKTNSGMSNKPINELLRGSE